MHPILLRLFKATPYSSFMNAYPLQRDYLRTIVETEQQLFANVRH
jgi:COP9 signalosome complex subunit 3